MFGKKERHNPQKPFKISGSLARLIGAEWGKVPQSHDHWVSYMAVSRARAGNPDQVDVRIFDEQGAARKHVEIRDFSSLDGHPDLVLMEGWYDQKSKKGSIKAKAA